MYLLLITVFTVNFGFAIAPEESAIVRGKLNDSEATEIKLLQAEEGNMVLVTTTKINSNGEFGFVVPITTPGFYYLDYGQMKLKKLLVRLYLEPKLDLSLTINNESGYTITGTKVGQNLIVHEANKIYDDFAKYTGLLSNFTYEEFYPFLEKEGVARANNFIKSIHTKDANFNKLIALAVQTDMEYHTFTFFRMPKPKFPEKTNRPAIVKQWTVDKKFTDPNLLKLGNAVDFMQNYFFYQTIESGVGFNPSAPITEHLSHITDPNLKEIYIQNFLAARRFKPENYEKFIGDYYPYLKSQKSKDLVLDIEKTFHKTVGQKGFEFTYKDANDKPVSFNDFKGKYVYIDLWATWCGPCKAEIPHLKKMEEEFRGKDIVFMSISVDKVKDTQKWKDFVKKEQLSGVQLIGDNAIDSGIAKNYDVNAIPRFLLFDKQGNIVSVDALRPSDPLLKEQLTKLLN